MFNEWFIDSFEELVFSFMITNQNASTKETSNQLSNHRNPYLLLKANYPMNNKIDYIRVIIYSYQRIVLPSTI